MFCDLYYSFNTLKYVLHTVTCKLQPNLSSTSKHNDTRRTKYPTKIIDDFGGEVKKGYTLSFNWTYRKSQANRIQADEMRFLRLVTRHTLQERKRNVAVRQEFNTVSIISAEMVGTP